jgi:hypothetical protein
MATPSASADFHRGLTSPIHQFLPSLHLSIPSIPLIPPSLHPSIPPSLRPSIPLLPVNRKVLEENAGLLGTALFSHDQLFFDLLLPCVIGGAWVSAAAR